MSSVASIDEIHDVVKRAIENLPQDQVGNFKIVLDRQNKIMRIYSAQTDGMARASAALREVSELAYSSAEHHPYWSMLFHCSEISRLMLESWDAQLSQDQWSEIDWRCQEMVAAVERLRNANMS